MQQRGRDIGRHVPGLRRSSKLAILLLAGGVALVLGGLAATNSMAGESSKVFNGTPSNTAVVLLVLGVLVGGLGLTRLLRRAA